MVFLATSSFVDTSINTIPLDPVDANDEHDLARLRGEWAAKVKHLMKKLEEDKNPSDDVSVDPRENYRQFTQHHHKS